MLAAKKIQLLGMLAVAILTLRGNAALAQYGIINPWFNPNPVVAGMPQVYTGSFFNPYTGTIQSNTYGERVLNSAYDPLRGMVDPGSMRYVTRPTPGGWVQGLQWTSRGVPHGELESTQLYPTSPWSTQQDRTRIFYNRDD